MSELEFLDIKQVADKLNVACATVRNWVNSGDLNTKNINNKQLFAINEIKEFHQKLRNNEISKLNSRANKTNSQKNFIPTEYLHKKQDKSQLQNIINIIIELNIQIDIVIFLLTVNLLHRKKLLKCKKIYADIIDIINHQNCKEIQIFIDLKVWQNSFKLKEKDYVKYQQIIAIDLFDAEDILGIIYQSLLNEGVKAQIGSYYTPHNIVNTITDTHIKPDMKVLDPCCGTGQFLLNFAKKISNPDLIYGYDNDPIAVRIARINLMRYHENLNFNPNIFCIDSIFDLNQTNNFDYIATNPPWGYYFNQKQRLKLNKLYPEIKSFESFSYILIQAIKLLKPNAKLSFILPESILNIKLHQDIRQFIINNSSITKVIMLERIFKNVFTAVVRLDIVKNLQINHYNICTKTKNFDSNSETIKASNNYIITTNITKKEDFILQKIFSYPHITTLKNNADFALGIVTGNNRKFISDTPKQGYEEIIRGKEIDNFILKPSMQYIKFNPKLFQQTASENMYRATEKLIYKFISKRLVFAYDNSQKLTLNSANIVIPKLKYPIKLILALFNSSLYQFIFQKRFNTIKILKYHIETLPLPKLNQVKINNIIAIIDKILDGKENDKFKLEQMIFDIFSINKEEQKLILSNIF